MPRFAPTDWTSRRRRHLATIGVSALLACGAGEDDGSDDRLNGLWSAQVPDTFCIVGFSFEADRYEYDLVCELNDGTFGLEAEVGSYETAGSRISFFPMQATCPDISPAQQDFTYDIINSGQTLRLIDPTGVAVFDRVERMASQGGGFARFGCFDNNLVLTERPIQNL